MQRPFLLDWRKLFEFVAQNHVPTAGGIPRVKLDFPEGYTRVWAALQGGNHVIPKVHALHDSVEFRVDATNAIGSFQNHPLRESRRMTFPARNGRDLFQALTKTCLLAVIALLPGGCIHTTTTSDAYSGMPTSARTQTQGAKFMQDLSVGRDGFQSGISDSSVGRFAGFRGELANRVACLNYEAGDMSMWANGSQILYLLPPPNYQIKRTANWFGRQTLITYGRGSEKTMQVNASIAVPAMRFSFSDSVLSLRLNPGLQAEHLAFPTKDGVKIVSSLEPYDGAGILYDRAKHGDITEPWALLFWGPANQAEPVPLLIVLEKQPEKLSTEANGGVIDGVYNGPAGSLTIMPIAGFKRFKKGELSDWHKKGVPEDVLAACRTWSKLLQVYPVACQERFRLDEAKGVVEIHDRFDYLENHGDWKTEKEYFAPISPLILHARKCRYPITLDGQVVTTDLLTGYGKYAYIQGQGFAYTLPSPSNIIDYVPAPVRVENDPKWDKVVADLGAYLKDPKWTFGGDYDYDPTTIMDAFHNVRILAWATWSLPEAKRIARFKELAKPIASISPDLYHHEVEPMTGREYWWNKQEFWQVGLVRWDFEWYGGMDLGSPWMYYQYGQGVTDKKDLEALLPYMEKWLGYMELTHDWLFLQPTQTIPGANASMDGGIHALHGVMGMARVAHVLGKKELESRLKYLAARMLVTWHEFWMGPEWQDDLADVGLAQKATDESNKWVTVGWNGFTADRLTGGPGVGRWTPYGDTHLEILEFYRQFLLGRIQHYEQRIDADIPDWCTKPIVHNNERAVMAGRNAPNAEHAYQKDPHLIHRSLLFREGLDELQTKYAIEHTGQVLECFLVGAHPMVLFPAGARFGGNVWNEKDHTLTTTLHPSADESVTVIIDWKTRPQKIEGCQNWTYKNGRAYVTVAFAGQSTIVLKTRF